MALVCFDIDLDDDVEVYEENLKCLYHLEYQSHNLRIVRLRFQMI